MKSFNKTAPILFLLVTVIFSALLTLLLLCGRYFIPANAPVVSGVVSAIALIFAYMSSEGKDIRFAGKNLISAILPFCAVFFGIFFTYNAKTDVIFPITTAVIYFLSALVIFYRCCDNKQLKIIMSIAYIIVLLIPFCMTMLTFMLVSGQKAEFTALAKTSPNGTYTAVAENTRVEVTANNKTKNIGIGTLQPFSHTIYEITGEVTADDMQWLDDTTLLINSKEYNMKYIGEANLFYNFSENSEKLSAYIPQRYYDSVDVPNYTTALYIYNLKDDEITAMQNDIANNSSWQKTDRQKICNILGVSDSELNLEYYDYYCTTAEECDKYTIVALYNESDDNLAVINKDLTIKY